MAGDGRLGAKSERLLVLGKSNVMNVGVTTKLIIVLVLLAAALGGWLFGWPSPHIAQSPDPAFNAGDAAHPVTIVLPLVAAGLARRTTSQPTTNSL